MAKSEKLGIAGVDTGMLLIIDPSYLFSEEEWLGEVGDRAKELDGDYPRAILQALADRTGRPMEDLAVVANVKGDGGREVSRSQDAIHIED